MAMSLGQTDNKTPVGTRDAFHVASILVNSTQIVKPGDKVRFVDNTYTKVIKCIVNEKAHAIVDPFLPPGNYYTTPFWVCLMPESTSNLHHHFDLKYTDVPLPYVPILHIPVERPWPHDDDEGYDECAGCFN